MIDSTSIRVHQKIAAQKNTVELIGRSRGGLSSKLYPRVNRPGLPLQIELAAGQMHDAPMAELLLQDLPKGTSLLGSGT
jgi:hypothetical protein